MDLEAARRALGVGPAPTWAEIRVAYLAQIAAAHPDRAGGDTRRAMGVTEAYATLERAHRSGAPLSGSARRSTPAQGAPTRRAPPSAGPAPMDEPPEVLDGDTVHLPVPPDEAFVRVVEACHQIGDVTYVDRSCAILEALVRVEGEGVCSLVITLQGRAEGTDAFCTLEALERVAAPPVRPVVHRLVAALRRPGAP
jgi:hypothetical protein